MSAYDMNLPKNSLHINVIRIIIVHSPEVIIHFLFLLETENKIKS